MAWLLNALYLFALALLSPWLAWRALRTGRYRRNLRDKLLGLAAPLPPGAVWFHGVSVGEVHLLRQVIAAFRRRRPDAAVVVSTTTDTGFEEARKAFPDLTVFAFPFDFSWAVRRTLRQVRPALIVLAESEVWPNFLLAARQAGVPVALINARVSPRSLARYRRLGPLARWLFRSFDLVVAQTAAYADALRELGAPAERVIVSGSVKYDGAQGDRAAPRTESLRQLLHVRPGEVVWVVGSTQAPEEEVCLEIFEKVKGEVPGLRLFLVPRQRDRFDEVARLLERRDVGFVRRSALPADNVPPVVLVDTIGELGALWGLADLAFVGGSLDGTRGGQNMIEPAAYGAAVTFGPHVWNFRDTAERLLAAEGAVQVADEAGLEAVVRRLLKDESDRRRLGEAARSLVLAQQGATERTVALLDGLLARREVRAA
jgi:3-deoxy-D-manno-octulosonic-acid transferase